MAELIIKIDDTLTDRILAAHSSESLDELQQTISEQLVERTKDYEVKQTELAEQAKRALAEEASRQVIEAKIATVQEEVKLQPVKK